ncbi:hypothetical protein RvY_08741 [Ramazzottius varieornatus]|uniref:Perilipin n=1 Tax=Ramazzottius varieornatus TaxID=947166 RepID=A0A1D1VBK7_RAMVA|nr:hypothetical protein RvY_08741 [Ramazzottius varieornatus]
MPTRSDDTLPSFMQVPDTPIASSPTSSEEFRETFMERVKFNPLVRYAFSRVQEAYEHTKDRHSVLRGVLERGEKTVAYSIKSANDVYTKTGLATRLQKPLITIQSVADTSACFVLDKVEEKLPIITKTPYEIKLMWRDKVEAKVDQLNGLKESTSRLLDDCKQTASQTLEETKKMGADKVQQVLETPYGQRLNHTLEQGLSVADDVLDRVLPEVPLRPTTGYLHTNGNGFLNGHLSGSSSHVSSNGHFQKSTYTEYETSYTATAPLEPENSLQHATQLVQKMVRRVVTRVKNGPLAKVQQMARRNVEMVSGTVEWSRQLVAAVTSAAYWTVADVTASTVTMAYTALMAVLPATLGEKVTIYLDATFEYLLRQKRGGAAAATTTTTTSRAYSFKKYQ